MARCTGCWIGESYWPCAHCPLPFSLGQCLLFPGLLNASFTTVLMLAPDELMVHSFSFLLLSTHLRAPGFSWLLPDHETLRSGTRSCLSDPPCRSCSRTTSVYESDLSPSEKLLGQILSYVWVWSTPQSIPMQFRKANAQQLPSCQ